MNQQKRYPTALTIAGSDSGGGAGIQADLKTFSAIGVYGTSVITAITVQNTCEVRRVETLSPELVLQQAEAVLDDMVVDVVKTGMLPTPEIIAAVAETVDKYAIPKLIVDPVMVATSGGKLTTAPTIDGFQKILYPRLFLLTPNIPEAEALTGITIRTQVDILQAGEILLTQGCRAVLIKGGHLSSDLSSDILFLQNESPQYFISEFIETANLHGTGCSLASAIAAYLALGNDLVKSVSLAKEYITNAILAGKNIRIGQGNGPVNHFFNSQPLKTIIYED